MKETNIIQADDSYTYLYPAADLSHEDMLGCVWDILKDDDISSHGVILFLRNHYTPMEIPVLPSRDTFVSRYRSLDLSCITAIMEYHGDPIMITYRVDDHTLAVVIPAAFRETIDDLEKNVIPDVLDHNPKN